MQRRSTSAPGPLLKALTDEARAAASGVLWMSSGQGVVLVVATPPGGKRRDRVVVALSAAQASEMAVVFSRIAAVATEDAASHPELQRLLDRGTIATRGLDDDAPGTEGQP